MSMFQTVNTTLTGAVLAAVIGGLAKYFDMPNVDPFEFLANNPGIICLGIFIMVLRVKTYMDDSKHFAEEQQDKTAFRFAGFIVALLSWVFWGLAGWTLHDTTRASELMFISLSISTAWIVIHLIEMLVDKPRIKDEQPTAAMRMQWIIVNLVYGVFLAAHIGWFRPAVPAGLTTPLVLLLLTLLVDLVISRSSPGTAKPDTKANVAPPQAEPGNAQPAPADMQDG